jgi:oxygen-independent coproporphyrinogen-3 oxidase
VYDQILPPEKYVGLLQKEISHKAALFPEKELASVYFGGGTPSLLSANLILSILDSIAKTNVRISPATEITVEINPATLDAQKIRDLIQGGVNRFSVGAQTFNDALLKAAGRKHTSQDTIDTLNLLRERDVNYSFDLLFALPKQSLDDLERDLDQIAHFQPPHLSAYCLTVPTGHPMSANRPSDDHQVMMFQKITERLKALGLDRYEISNFARRGFESKHNLLYWRDEPYIGVGLSAHSYLKHTSQWGHRFWNPSSIEKYEALYSRELPPARDALDDSSLGERLDEADSLFDFCHTALRLDEGLKKTSLRRKYAAPLVAEVEEKLLRLKNRGLIVENDAVWSLSSEGVLLSNYVFSEVFPESAR